MSTVTAIPCKRPKVTVVETARHSGHFVVSCLVPGCGFRYPAGTSTGIAIKTDAEEQARRHRDGHRRAVPAVTVIRPHGSAPFHVECLGCGFRRSDGTTTTKVDAEGVQERHLVNDHGLVTC